MFATLFFVTEGKGEDDLTQARRAPGKKQLKATDFPVIEIRGASNLFVVVKNWKVKKPKRYEKNYAFFA